VLASARAGELGALWLQHSASMSVKLGPRLGAARIQQEARNWIAKLGAADPALGTAATALVEMLARTQPKEGAPRLVHGSLYVRHVLDLGDSAGLIDWDCFGQGPLEIDGGMFLATVSRIGLLSEGRAGEAARAEQAFLSGTADLLAARAGVAPGGRAAAPCRTGRQADHSPAEGLVGASERAVARGCTARRSRRMTAEIGYFRRFHDVSVFNPEGYALAMASQGVIRTGQFPSAVWQANSP
jgi:hypothetical protein